MKPPIKVNFNPDLFNNVFWHLKKAFNNAAIRFIWVYGGSSASKTYSVVQLCIIEMMAGNNNNALILRKYAVDIRDSIYSDFKTVINDWGLQDHFTCQTNFIKCSTGSYVRFRGLDDSEKIKGIANFKRVVLEEISQFDEIDLKQIRKRLRGKSGQQIIGIFNPISEEHWIKTNIFDKETLTPVPTDISGMWVNAQGNLIIMQTNYLDNRYIVGPNFVDQHTIDDFEKDKLNDWDYYNVYGLGNWGRLRTGGEFWKDFNTNKHIQPVKWDKAQPIWFFWDENVNPYLPASVWQVQNNNLVQIDEFAFVDPMNRVKHVCAEFCMRYPQSEVQGLFIGGDRTAIKEDVKLEKGENFFTEIRSQLIDYKPHLKLLSANPSVVKSGEFVNEAYAGRQPFQIIIGSNCKKSIYDYSYCLEDSDGTIFKKKVKNKITGVTFEEFGHFSDIKRYVATMVKANDYQKYLAGKGARRIAMGKSYNKHI